MENLQEQEYMELLNDQNGMLNLDNKSLKTN
jgi:hypothetical protein